MPRPGLRVKAIGKFCVLCSTGFCLHFYLHLRHQNRKTTNVELTCHRPTCCFPALSDRNTLPDVRSSLGLLLELLKYFSRKPVVPSGHSFLQTVTGRDASDFTFCFITYTTSYKSLTCRYTFPIPRHYSIFALLQIH